MLARRESTADSPPARTPRHLVLVATVACLAAFHWWAYGDFVGRFFAFEHWGLEPDMITLAKALSGGYVPVGAVLCRGEIFDRTFHRIQRAVVHGSTFAKNPLAMTAGLATLHVLESERLAENAARMGELFLERLSPLVERYEFFHAVRGKGLMIALEFGKPDSFKLKTDGKTRKQPSSTTEEDVRMSPVGLIAPPGGDIVYVAAGEHDRILAYRLKRNGVLAQGTPFSETEEQPGSFPNDVAIAVLPGGCG